MQNAKLLYAKLARAEKSVKHLRKLLNAAVKRETFENIVQLQNEATSLCSRALSFDAYVRLLDVPPRPKPKSRKEKLTDEQYEQRIADYRRPGKVSPPTLDDLYAERYQG